jgi:hypothetical protein
MSTPKKKEVELEVGGHKGKCKNCEVETLLCSQGYCDWCTPPEDEEVENTEPGWVRRNDAEAP